jgi:hypothetical protein
MNATTDTLTLAEVHERLATGELELVEAFLDGHRADRGWYLIRYIKGHDEFHYGQHDLLELELTSTGDGIRWETDEASYTATVDGWSGPDFIRFVADTDEYRKWLNERAYSIYIGQFIGE